MVSSTNPASLARAGRLLGLDVGDRRIGMAVSVPPGELILPAGYVQRRSRRADVATIRDEAEWRDAVAIIVGMPYDAHGASGEQARKTASFVRALERVAAVPVLTVDEGFTSHAGATELRESGREPSRERGSIDAAAAVAILRGFLTPRTASSSPPPRKATS